MQVRRLPRLAARIAVALAVLAPAAIVWSGPASAYGSLSVVYALVDTDNCRRIEGQLWVTAGDNGCSLSDSADGTFFEKDAGGRAQKVQLHDGVTMVAKIEFHPYGEKLWVYDTSNDGDTIYVTVAFGCLNSQVFGPYRAPGTSNPIDYTVVDFDVQEGCYVGIHVRDQPNDLDRITLQSATT
ncbi:hypothetical protein [Micromonospora sp. CPCC 206061]|uniref:hypothetical protein n=1 Tax=Micromonospora sp. CPCC 206061 TaxID=3122410 RepID=UPI002FEF1937